jgi:hypothetical protein
MQREHITGMARTAPRKKHTARTVKAKANE